MEKILWVIFILITFFTLTLPKTTSVYIGYSIFAVIYAVVFLVINKKKGGAK